MKNEKRENPQLEIHNPQSKIQELVAVVASSPKYRTICPELVERIARQELGKRRNLREAVKATKNKLHQVGGAYLDSAPPYSAWLTELQAAPDSTALRATCARLLSTHASTRERLPLLDNFYPTLFEGLPPIHSISDIACGLNPLTLPWMPLAENATYHAFDIYTDMMAFLGDFMALPALKILGRAQAADALQLPTLPHAEVALLFKAIPCLEQVDKTAGAHLLEAIAADYLFVSFPAHSLGRRDKGMIENYTAHFEALTAGKPWEISRFEFASELVFRVKR